MPNTFYRAFEDRLRGPRELIKERQKVYLPFLQPLKQLYAENLVLDLGCGRGEWLEVLLGEGFQARGVDLDEGMLEACEALSLPAEQGEAIAMLERTPAVSISVVSGFHIAEHMPFSHLQHLVGEALRVLKPAGLLILETPNPENLVVGTNNFYLDPTHERPIPHLALNFLAEYSGFARTKTLRLQELPQLLNETNLELMHVLGGASPDYGIVAQKSAAEEQLALFDDAFAKEYGLALDILAWRYDHGLKSKIREVAEKMDSYTQKEVALSGHLELLQFKSEQLEQRAANFDANIDLIRHQSQQAAELAAQARAGASSLELRAVQLETVVDQLRLQLQESGLRLLQSEARSQQAEMALREWLARATLGEARHAAAEAINESLRQQARDATAEMLASYKTQQSLELMLGQTQQALSSAQQELQSSRDESEQVSAEDLRARQLLEQTLVQTQQALSSTQQELQSSRDESEQVSAENMHARQLLEQTLTQTEQALSNTQQELQSVRDEVEQVSAESMHARQLLEETIAQSEDHAGALELELSAVRRCAEMLEGECDEAQRELTGSREQIGGLEAQLRALNLQFDELNMELDAVHQHKHQIHADLLSTEAYKHNLHASLVELEVRMRTIQHQLHESLGSAHHWWQQTVALEQRIKALLSSTSWRITWPLRGLSRAVRWTLMLPIRLAKSIARPVIHLVIRQALGRPALRMKLSNLLRRHPKLHQHLRLFAKRRSLIDGVPPVDTSLSIQAGFVSSEQATVSHPGDVLTGADLSALSVEARRYFHQLNTAIEQQQPGSL